MTLNVHVIIWNVSKYLTTIGLNIASAAVPFIVFLHWMIFLHFFDGHLLLLDHMEIFNFKSFLYPLCFDLLLKLLVLFEAHGRIVYVRRRYPPSSTLFYGDLPPMRSRNYWRFPSDLPFNFIQFIFQGLFLFVQVQVVFPSRQQLNFWHFFRRIWLT